MLWHLAVLPFAVSPLKDTFNNEDHEAMTSIPWAKEFPGDITVCDAAGVILEMNNGGAKSFAKTAAEGLSAATCWTAIPNPRAARFRSCWWQGRSTPIRLRRAA